LKADETTLAENMLEPATMVAAFEDTRKILEEGSSEPQLLKIVESTIAIAADLWDDFKADAPAVECRKGCSWCCYQLVATTAPEVIYAARFIRATFDNAEFRTLRDHLATHVETAAGLTSGEHIDLNIPCPFLEDDVCSIYDARPMHCRGVHSESAAFCHRLLDERATLEAQLAAGEFSDPFLLVPKVLHNSVQVGMASALDHAGNKTNLLDFAAAMQIALGNGDIAKSWLEGKPVFEAARLWRTDGDEYATNSTPAV
jgi:hypothetical protein